MNARETLNLHLDVDAYSSSVLWYSNSSTTSETGSPCALFILILYSTTWGPEARWLVSLYAQNYRPLSNLP